jgi:hypothetical protein
MVTDRFTPVIARTFTSTICFVLVAMPTLAAQQPARRFTQQTRPERSKYLETSTYADVMAFLTAAAAASPRLQVTSFGYSMEGRALPLVIVGNIRDARKLRVFIQANIHAGEVEGKEAIQVILRDLANGRHSAWLDSLVLLIAPIYNADGNERVRLTNRPLQYGPIGGMGQRANAQNLDLNRDHMKLESPEARSLVALFNKYDPHVMIDLHTTDGTVHAYHLTYAPPLHPNTHPAIDSLLRRAWFPAVTRAIKQKDRWDFYYYGNVPGAGAPSDSVERGWYSFDHRPRFNNNYVGLRNRIAILSEAYSYATFEERIRATRRFVEEILDYAGAHAGRIRAVVAAADSGAVPSELALRADLEPSRDSVEILMGEISEERHPYTGQRMWVRRNVRKPERMREFQRFRATESARVPTTYFVPPTLDAVIQLLAAHGIRSTRLEAPAERAVERFMVDSSRQEQREFQGHKERMVFGRWDSTTVTLPVGTVVVPMNQPLARLVFALLEPRSDDGVVDWNIVDDAIAKGSYPVLRSFQVIR